MINTTVTVIQDMFGFTNSVVVFGLIGCAAFNAGGEAIHHGVKVPVKSTKTSVDCQLSKKKQRFFAVAIQKNGGSHFQQVQHGGIENLGRSN